MNQLQSLLNRFLCIPTIEGYPEPLVFNWAELEKPAYLRRMRNSAGKKLVGKMQS
jgi:hypothetical protein